MGGSWQWLTGEPFIYTNWAPGEPNNTNVETALAIFGDSNSLDKIGKWNNIPPDTSLGPIYQLWSVVEFPCCTGLRGNVGSNSSGSVTDISDLLFIVDYLYGSPAGPAPLCSEEADVDGSGELDIADVLYLVQFQFANPNGPAPVACP